MVNIRLATTNDIQGIAHVEVDSWKKTYKGIITTKFLKRLTHEWSEKRHTNILYDSKKFTYVAENETGEVIGFAAAGIEDNPLIHFEGELYTLYLLEEYQRKGIGKKLISSVTDYFQDMSINSMLLYVLKENHSAREFYKVLGGQEIHQGVIQLGELKYKCMIYGWLDLKSINRLVYK